MKEDVAKTQEIKSQGRKNMLAKLFCFDLNVNFIKNNQVLTSIWSSLFSALSLAWDAG